MKVTDAMCRVWKVGSFGMKSSDALAVALFFELRIDKRNDEITYYKTHIKDIRGFRRRRFYLKMESEL